MNRFRRSLLLVLMMSTPLVSAQEIIAHRGASGDAPENTLAAFRLAWEQGADGIEGDFRLTADGEVVCLHDRDTSRVTAGQSNLTVAQATLRELQSLDVGVWKGAEFAGEKIPTLAEVLRELKPGGKFYLEIKGDPELVPPIVKVLTNERTDLSKVTVIAFDPSTVAEVRKLLPQVQVLWLVSYERDPDTGQWKPRLDQILKTLRHTKAHGLGTQANPEVVTADFVKTLRQHGYFINVWTVNDEPLARYFRDLGVDSITTDFPAKIRQAISHGTR